MKQGLPAQNVTAVRSLRAFVSTMVSSMALSVFAQPISSVPTEGGAAVFFRASPSVFVIRARTPTGTSQGSGVAYRYGYNSASKPDRTWIATNAHVVLDGASFVVESGGASRKATVEYADTDLDIALVAVEGEVLPLAKMASVQQTAIGSRVFAIGSPLGLENTISEGLLSGVRELKGVRVIQTSAAISNGNSGGGLFDAEGRLLGITTFKLKGGENLNFAVDSRYIKVIDDALLASNLIRAGYERKVVRPGDKDDLDERYVESRALTRWLLEQKSADGSPLYAYVNRAVSQSYRSGRHFSAGHPDFDAILRNFLAGRHQPINPSPPSSRSGIESELYRLTCPMHASNDGSFKFDLNLSVDADASLVNGRIAKFTDSEIRFMTGKDAAFIAVLNRYSARVSISSAQFQSMLTGTCTNAVERRF